MTSLTYFTTFSSVSVVDFEQVNVSWERPYRKDILSGSQFYMNFVIDLFSDFVRLLLIKWSLLENKLLCGMDISIITGLQETPFRILLNRNSIY